MVCGTMKKPSPARRPCAHVWHPGRGEISLLASPSPAATSLPLVVDHPNDEEIEIEVGEPVPAGGIIEERHVGDSRSDFESPRGTAKSDCHSRQGAKIVAILLNDVCNEQVSIRGRERDKKRIKHSK